MPCNLRAALRHETADLDDALEDQVEKLGCFETPIAYRRWLVKMQSLHMLFAADYDEGCRLMGLEPMSLRIKAALEKDVGLSQKLPGKGCLPANYAMGVAYVFEGSAVRGRLLLRRLALFRAAPDAYLTTLVGASKSRWPVVRESCERIDISHTAPHHPAIYGARIVFGAFLKAFGGHAQ